jgi:hypothetical protein
MSVHPDDETLRQWLEHGRPGRVTRHLDECELCLDRLDALTDLGEMKVELAGLGAPPVDLHRRTTGGVQGRLAAEEAVLALVDLFTLPWRTAEAILGGSTRSVDAAGAADHHSHDDGEQTDE